MTKKFRKINFRCNKILEESKNIDNFLLIYSSQTKLFKQKGNSKKLLWTINKLLEQKWIMK